MSCYAQIIIKFATTSQIDKPFTYEIPPELSSDIQIGQRVKVPFGMYNHLQVGYVLGLTNQVAENTYRMKKVASIIDFEPILTKEQIEVVEFIVTYYGVSYASAIDVVLPPGLKGEPIAKVPEYETVISVTPDSIKLKAYCLSQGHKKTFNKQKWIIDYVQTCGKVTLCELKVLEDVSISSLKTLLKNGYLVQQEEPIQQMFTPICYDAFKVLNKSQDQAVSHIRELGFEEIYRTVLLQGITGSGKTEVFLHTIKEVIENGGSALVLVPEIALTEQTVSRFRERFGNRVALSHSRMTAKERQRLYMSAKQGKVSIIIGPRSAVFMPLPNLKLIVIDEAHEASYKSDTTPKYHAIDIAQKRMEMAGGQVVLATATPSLESYYEALQGNYDLLRLDERIGNATLPDVELVDMRQELKNGNTNVLSRKLYEAIESALAADGQVMLLINRRGHSTFINCRNCGYVVKCEHCDVSMTYHLSTQSLECHYCGKTKKVPEVCPECGSKYIRFFGSGTEKVEAFLQEHFSEYGILRMDMDTTTGKEGHQKILNAFKNKEASILIGTQMIAKGHDFPAVTLVGILSADMSLYIQDFRSNERTFQLLTQAMGRAGRGENKGKVVIQTYNPEHMVMEVIKNNQQAYFYEQELMNRKVMGYPPFSHIFTVLVTGNQEDEVIRTAHKLMTYYTHYSSRGQTEFRIIGPSSAVISKIGDEYRWRIIILSKERDKVLVFGKYCLGKFINNEQIYGIKIQWDIDPLTIV